MLYSIESLEIHTEIAGQEAQRQEKTRNDGELFHAVVLVRSDGVENEIYQVVRRSPHLIVAVLNEKGMVFDIT